ncbi:MAG: hypothetical protein ABS75_10375 [Pelagibacterium sp. SCN 63-23]|nr:MAG: hypothetical protein ABS75_10375 [Pelagibacterium sp. SCN 63-23]
MDVHRRRRPVSRLGAVAFVDRAILGPVKAGHSRCDAAPDLELGEQIPDLVPLITESSVIAAMGR